MEKPKDQQLKSIDHSVRAYDSARLTWRREQTEYGWGFWYLIRIDPPADA
jgi:hypothetical protein